MILRMAQIGVDQRKLERWAAERRLTMPGDDLGYAVHSLLKEIYGAYAPKPFRVLARANTTAVLGYTAADRATMADHAATFAEPSLLDIAPLDRFAVKDMPAQWRPGQRLGFEVRVRPVIRQDHDGDRGRSREKDAFLAEASRVGPEVTIERETVYVAWLSDHFTRQGGVEIERARLASFRRGIVGRRDAVRGLRGSEGPDAVLAGTLSIHDGATFTAWLARGVGRHRAFGFGMLLLRPPV